MKKQPHQPPAPPSRRRRNNPQLIPTRILILITTVWVKPANLLGSLSLFNLSGSSVERQTIETGDVEEADIDPVAVRQNLVDELAAVGITEAEVADFLAAYDLLVSEDFMTAYVALTDEERQAYEAALVGVLEDYFQSFFNDCDLSNLFNIEVEADELQADFMACVVAAINQLGRDIVSVSREHGLVPAAETEEQVSQ